MSARIPENNRHRRRVDGGYRADNKRYFKPAPPGEKPEEWVLQNFPDSQAKRIILKFGGVLALIRAMKKGGIVRTKESVYHWLYNGGLIPPNGARDIFIAELEAGIVLTPEDWYPYCGDIPEPEPEPHRVPAGRKLVL